MAERRRGNLTHHKARQAARQRAMTVLSHNHPLEFHSLLEIEMNQRGVYGSPTFGGSSRAGRGLDESPTPTSDTHPKS